MVVLPNVTHTSGASHTLDGGKYGKLVPPANSEKLQKALEELIANLDKARNNAAKGRDYLLDYMSAQRVAKEYLEIYKKVLKK